MYPVKGVFASLVLLIIGFVTATAQTQKMDEKAIYFDSEKVTESFAPLSPRTAQRKSLGLLYETPGFGKGEGGAKKFQVRTSHRVDTGVAEIHMIYTDVVYVLEGTATFVTGGRLVDSKTAEVNELRGTAIEGGETHHMSKGDVIIIPNGVPHWWKEVQGNLLYYVVKIQ
jgi:mannose-6-phosphate isomerase-like protein (cupin superfamily)